MKILCGTAQFHETRCMGLGRQRWLCYCRLADGTVYEFQSRQPLGFRDILLAALAKHRTETKP